MSFWSGLRKLLGLDAKATADAQAPAPVPAATAPSPTPKPAVTHPGSALPMPKPVPTFVVGDPPGGMWFGGIPDQTFVMSKVLEGYSAKPYQDDAKVWTIGFGSTRMLDERPVMASTPPITEEFAMALKTRDLAVAESRARGGFPKGLPVRWAATMILMCNNLGVPKVWGATLHKLLNEKRWAEAAEQMRHYRNAGGKPNLGLRRRRWCEAAYALGMDFDEAHRQAWSRINHVDDWPKLPKGGY